MHPQDPAPWQPSATLDTLRRRARMLERIRAFFAQRGVLEVDTAILLSAAVTDPALASFSTRYTGPSAPQGRTLYLHTSPEFAMKRLLAAGSGSIYQVCKVFRDGENGRWHNPEFTMLEWYRVGFDHRALMDEVALLVSDALAGLLALPPAEYLSYREAFQRHLALDPHTTDCARLRACAQAHGIDAVGLAEDDIDGWRDLLLTHLIQPHLGRKGLSFVYDYPGSQAALARVRPGEPPLAERFEVFLRGLELANGFHELTDAAEQRRRFDADVHHRRRRGQPVAPPDRRFLAALEQGLPPCAGVAVGLDRLLAAGMGATALEETLAFPLESV